MLVDPRVLSLFLWLCSLIHFPVGIELISPVLEFEKDSKFREYVTAVWKCIYHFCYIETNDTCSTHVHISPSTFYSLTKLQLIARAVLYYEPVINALVPPQRQGNSYCKSFYASNSTFKGRTPAQAIDEIDVLMDGNPDEEIDEEHKTTLVNMLNPEPGARSFSWNFTNLQETDRPNTVEFRQGPGVTSPGATLAWAEFVVTFVNAAFKKAGSYDDLKTLRMNVGGLKAFLEQGKDPDISNASLLTQITARANDSAAIFLQETTDETTVETTVETPKVKTKTTTKEAMKAANTVTTREATTVTTTVTTTVMTEVKVAVAPKEDEKIEDDKKDDKKVDDKKDDEKEDDKKVDKK